MSMKPVLKTKVDELFLVWFTQPETQSLLRTSLRQLVRGEPVTWPSAQVATSKLGNGVANLQPKSPRVRPTPALAGPPYSPTSSLSPRVKNFTGKGPRPLPIKGAGSAKEVSAVQQPSPPAAVNVQPPAVRKEAVSPAPTHGLPDGDSDSFLRQKEAELRQRKEAELQQKRERERQQSELDRDAVTRSKVAAVPPDSTLIITQPTPEVVSFSTVADIRRQTDEKVPQPVEPTAVSGTGDSTVPVIPVLPSKNSTTVPVVTTQTVAENADTKTVAPQSVAVTPAIEPVLSSSATVATKPVTVPASTIPETVPQFYFPLGIPGSVSPEYGDAVLRKVKEEFDKIEGGRATKSQMAAIVKALDMPHYWKAPFFKFAGGEKVGHITLQATISTWKTLTSSCYDDAARFLRMLARQGHQYLEFDDFLPLIQDVVDTHPGLTFLQDAPEFHSRYVQTVISRIFYCINRSWTGRITVPELRKSNFLQTVKQLSEEDDINQILDFFSYEHFYVIYCKFWELDKDHDLLISKEDLGRHNDHAVSTRVIDRIFSGAVTKNLVDGKLTYRDFVWFLISEEDKKYPRSIEYWFRCMDLDGDGIISMYEMEYFYEEQVEKMEMLGIETLPFQDCLCQMLDMIRPKEEGKIRLQDLKTCALTPIFFDTFLNLDKYLEHEQRDPFASIRDQESGEPELSDWERYAAEEYELLVAEEGANDQQQEDVTYEDDFESDTGSPSSPAQSAAGAGAVASPAQQTKKATTPNNNAANKKDSAAAKKDDIYDFSNKNLGY